MYDSNIDISGRNQMLSFDNNIFINHQNSQLYRRVWKPEKGIFYKQIIFQAGKWTG